MNIKNKHEKHITTHIVHVLLLLLLILLLMLLYLLLPYTYIATASKTIYIKHTIDNIVYNSIRFIQHTRYFMLYLVNIQKIHYHAKKVGKKKKSGR